MKRFGVFLTTFLISFGVMAADIFNLADTWNSGSTTFNAIKVTITDTGSAADSNFIHIIRGANVFRVDREANIVLTGFVDGRDVDADGTKLDGIAVGAQIGDLLADGTVPLSSNWDVGAFTITGTQFVSDIATGTAPLVISSTTVVPNLNVSQLEGNAASAFATAAQGATADTANQPVMTTKGDLEAFSTVRARLGIGTNTHVLTADSTQVLGMKWAATTGGDLLADGSVPLTANWDVGAFSITGLRFISDQATGTAPFTVASTTVVTNLNADLLDGFSSTAFASSGQGDLADSATQPGDNISTLTNDSGFTDDQTGAEIKTAYEVEVNAFTDAQFTKLAGIETGAEVNVAIEGTAVLSTGEVGGTKFLREDGDNSSSWQVAGDMLASVYDASAITEQLVGLTAAQTLTNKTLNDITNHIHSDVVHALVRNESGNTLFAGTPVYISGYSIGQELILVQAADASEAATMPALGVLEEDLLNNATGHTITSGNAGNMDTFGLAIGAALYVSETAGELTIDRPTGDALVQKVGIILRAHATMGAIDVVGAGRINAIPNTMLDTVVRIVDDGNETRQIAFQASGITAGNTRTITMPDADVDLGIFLTSVEGSAVLSTGEVGGTKYLREDGDGTSSWQSIAGGGDALVANPLSQFAATTSLQLLGVISNETGSGALVFGTAPALSSPTGIVTNDVTESADKNYVTDAESTVIGNTSNTNTGDDAGVTSVAGGVGLTSTGGDTPSLSHDSHTGDVTGATELTIGNDKVTYAKMQNVVNDERIWGRVSGADGVVEELTKAQVLTMLNVADGATVDQTNISGNAATVTTNANLTGVVTSAGNATSIADKALAIAKLADGTDGELITWDSSGVIAVVAAGSEDEVLTSNGAGSAPTFQVLANPVESFIIAISDETTDLTTGLKVTFRMPYAFTASAVRASLTTAATGSLFIVDIQESGVTVLSTNISIDISEKTSTTAETAPVIDDADWADDAEITIIIDQIGSSDAGAGGKVTIIGERT